MHKKKYTRWKRSEDAKTEVEGKGKWEETGMDKALEKDPKKEHNSSHNKSKELSEGLHVSFLLNCFVCCVKMTPK